MKYDEDPGVLGPDSTEAECPWCGEKWQDLWDYEWNSRDEIVVECPFCGEDVVLTCETVVQYTTCRKVNP